MHLNFKEDTRIASRTFFFKKKGCSNFLPFENLPYARINDVIDIYYRYL